jgi:regulator of replication initiation timing
LIPSLVLDQKTEIKDMNSQSPIPRTDAAWEAYCIDPDRNNPWDFAEQLERELQEAIGYANRLVEHKSMVCLPADLKNLREANAHFAIENEALRDKLDKLQKELEYISNDEFRNDQQYW